MFNKLTTVIYHVDDLQKAKAWYTSLTGINPYFDEPFYIGFDINGCELGLDPDMQKIKEGNQTVIYWSVDDIHEAVEKAIAVGAEIVSPIQNVGGKIQVSTIKDPFGNHIGLIAGA
jgi:predicted enzyme related to lactoylglutathione lyase